VAQRLARQLCTYCKQRTTLSQELLAESGIRVGADVDAWERVGCTRCSGTGYRGRIGLFSVMPMSEEIKDLALTNAPESEISMIAREQGMLTLREDGLRKLRAGVTSIDEIARVTR
jgi:type IV pilus assembly protein PilB